jgi:hypothetical protein
MGRSDITTSGGIAGIVGVVEGKPLLTQELFEGDKVDVQSGSRFIAGEDGLEDPGTGELAALKAAVTL